MSVNGITSSTTADLYSTYSNAASKSKENTEKKPVKEESGALYETSDKSQVNNEKKTYKADPNLIAKLKEETKARTSQLRTLVEQMMGKQTNAFGQANDMWQFLAKGDYTVDAATKAQAQADVAEDGYWGVTQTSDRIMSFASALTGGNPDKIEEMRAAFQKGYKAAEKTWGGKLPEISQRTYDAVMSKFDKLAEDAGLMVKKEENTTL